MPPDVDARPRAGRLFAVGGGRQRQVRDLRIAAIVLVAGLVGSLVGALLMTSGDRRNRTRELEALGREARTLIDHRVTDHMEILHALRAQADQVHVLPRHEFVAFVERADVLRRLSGIRAVTFDPVVARDAVDAFESEVRAQAGALDPAYRGYAVHPRPAAVEAYPVDYLAPIVGNEDALGFDVGSEPSRRAAIEMARDSGEVVGTPPVALLLDPDGPRGLLTLLAAYRSTDLPTTPPERRRTFVGVFSVVLELPTVLDGALGTRPRADVEIYDVGRTLEEPASGLAGASFVYDSNDIRHDLNEPLEGLHAVLDLDVAGRRWRIVATPVAGQGLSREPWLVGLGGALVSVLLAGLLLQLLGGRGRRSTEILRSALEFGPDAVVVVDTGGVIVHANVAIEQVFGYRPEEIIGRSVELLVPDRFGTAHAAHRAHYTEAPLARPMGARSDLWGRRKDGSEVAIDVRLSPLEVEGRMLFGAAVRDISERRRAEAERALLAAIVESSDDAIYSVGIDHQVMAWNAGAARVYGYTAEEIVGRPIDLLVPGNRLHEVTDSIDAVLRGEHVVDFETSRRRRDGALIDVALTISPVVDANGVVVGESVIARDITARKAAQHALEQAFERERSAGEQLRETDRLKDEFLDIAAHELRTPLAAIMGFTDLLVDTENPLDDALRDDVAQRISGNAHQMGDMVERLLDFSRLRAGRVHLFPQEKPLADVVSRALARHAPALRGRRVVTDVRPDIVAVLDIDAVDHVLANLLGNAAKFSPVDQPIELSATTAGREVVVRVSDHGPGVDPDDLPRLFDRFFQGRSQPGGVRGTGIGLSIVRHYVELLGGRVWVESPVGEGATFVFTLRRFVPPDAADSAAMVRAREEPVGDDDAPPSLGEETAQA